MKHIIQLVSHQSGVRSEPFHCEIPELRDQLLAMESDGTLVEEDYILLVATLWDDDSGEEQMMIPPAPLLKISTFLGYDEEDLKAHG